MITLTPRTMSDRLRQAADRLGGITPRSEDMPVVAAVQLLLEETAAELGQPRLTPGEVEVLQQLAVGLSRAEIAGTLRVPVAVVNGRLRRAYAELGAGNRREAVAAAHRLGLLEADR
jgi:DNA-binding CsgD family transcriptional regulator